MAAYTSLAPVEYVTDDVNKVINHIISNLECFLEHDQQLDKLVSTQNELNQLRSIFQLVEMKAAEQLIADMLIASEQFMQISKTAQQKQISALSYALIMIGRYLEFVSNKPRGTGLGLAITKRLAELMGGTLSLKSKEGEGSTFSLILPTECKFEAETPAKEFQENLLEEAVAVR